jgi:hypothetical protein
VLSGPGRASLRKELSFAIESLFPRGCTRRPVTPNLKLPVASRRYGGLAASLVLHAVLIGLLAAQGERLWSRTFAPGDPSLPGSRAGGGGGGNRVTYITLPSIPRPASPPVLTVTAPTPPQKTVPTPVLEPVQSSQVPPDTSVEATTTAPADTSSGAVADGSNGTGAGGGRAAGDGSGVGAGAGAGLGGQGGTGQPPEPHDMAFPFDTPPKELRGVSLNVTFWVRADGRVERYQVEPQIKDREYAKKFDEVMRAFRFTPARAPNGSRVAGTTSISFTLPGKSSS